MKSRSARPAFFCKCPEMTFVTNQSNTNRRLINCQRKPQSWGGSVAFIHPQIYLTFFFLIQDFVSILIHHIAPRNIIICYLKTKDVKMSYNFIVLCPLFFGDILSEKIK